MMVFLSNKKWCLPLLIGILVLSIGPLMVYVLDWSWCPDLWTHDQYRIFKKISKTASTGNCIYVSIALALYMGYCLKYSAKQMLIWLVLIVIIINISLALKNVIKHHTEEARPYVAWMRMDEKLDMPKAFYDLSKKQRIKVLDEQMKKEAKLPRWVQNTWKENVDSSFPSGHSFFVSIWALLGCIFMWPRRHRVFTVILLLWANLVMLSRIFMGMHWIHDVFASIILAAMLVAVLCLILNLIHDRLVDKKTP